MKNIGSLILEAALFWLFSAYYDLTEGCLGQQLAFCFLTTLALAVGWLSLQGAERLINTLDLQHLGMIACLAVVVLATAAGFLVAFCFDGTYGGVAVNPALCGTCLLYGLLIAIVNLLYEEITELIARSKDEDWYRYDDYESEEDEDNRQNI